MTKTILRGIPAFVLAFGGLAYGVVAIASGDAPGLSTSVVAADSQLTATDSANPTVTARDWEQVSGTTTAPKNAKTKKSGKKAFR